MLRINFWATALLASAALLSACGGLQPNRQANMANPASVFCEENGGQVVMRKDSAGGEAGICVFKDGSWCDEWAYFRGECKPGDSNERQPLEAVSTLVPGAALETEEAGLGWKKYVVEEMGLAFYYPGDAALELDSTGRSVGVIGPLQNNEHYPIFYINFPDREDFHPPEGADLRQWLAEHNLLQGELREPAAIAGTEAIHVRDDNTQAYDDDRFYFAHAGQLYEVVLVHSGNEDWALYERFLMSIEFR